MKKWIASAIGLVAAFALVSSAHAQVAVATPDAAVATAGGAAAPTKNLWSFLFPSQEQCAALKDCICNTAIGEFAKSAAKPLTAATGGLLFSKCGVPTAEDLAKMAAAGTLDSEVGAAAKIKKSEAEAAARREAVRYLGTVDCNYWPEAKDALKAALRSDPNECVRYEAALALSRGCCCNKDIIDALRHSANGTKGDGAPAESSPRVRDAASMALSICAGAFSEEVAEPEKKLKEAPVPPITRDQKRSKGLLGVFFAAATPPSTQTAPLQTAPLQTAPPPVMAPVAPVVTTPVVTTPVAALPVMRTAPPAIQPVAHMSSTAALASGTTGPQPVPAPAPPRPQRGLLRHLIPGGNTPPAQVMDNVRSSDLGPVNRGYVILDK
jgi:hypothetical protein